MTKKKGVHMDPNFSLVAKLLTEAGFDFRFDPVTSTFLLSIESEMGKSHVVNIAVNGELLRLACVALEARRIPDAARPRLCEILLSGQPAGQCRYSLDRDQNVVISVAIQLMFVTKDVFVRLAQEITSELHLFEEKILNRCPLRQGVVLLFPARLQPPHSGHIDTVRKLLEADESVLADPRREEDKKLLENLETLIVSIGPVMDIRQKGNPLTVRERIDLLEREIEHNAELARHKHRIKLVPSPTVPGGNLWLPVLLSCLTERPGAVVSGNSLTLQIAQEQGLRVVEISRGEGKSGTDVRSLITEGKMEEARLHMTTTIYERCTQLGLFDIIRRVEGSR